MKKLLSILFATMIAGQAWAYDFTSGGICYSNVTGGVAVVAMNENNPYLNYPSLEGTVVIPDNVSGKPVIEIAENAFHNAIFTEIIIGRNVTKVGTGAFANCKNLERVISEKSKPSVWDEYNCRAATYWNAKKENGFVYQIKDRDLQTAQIVLYVGNATELSDFETTVTIDDVECIVTAICDNAFSGCSGLTSIEIPNTITSIGNSAFKDCSSLTTINIPDNVTSIGTSTFEGCSSLTSIEIPNSVVSIGNSAFLNCNTLTSIDIPVSVTSIGNSAFSGCISLAAINVANGNANYCSEDGVLFNNTKTSLICFPAGYPNASYSIPEGINGIDGGTFVNCIGLTSITIPISVKSIATGAFSGCSSLESMTLPITNRLVYIFGKNNYAGGTAVRQGEPSYDTYYIPSSLKTIEIIGCNAIPDYAFYGCSSLTSIIMPDTVKSIGQYSFYLCSGLTSITIPDSVSQIGKYAFNGCSGLTSLTIPNSVKYIAQYSFQGCVNLKTVIIPASVTAIDENSFDTFNSATVYYCAAPYRPSGWYYHSEMKRAWNMKNGTVYWGMNPIITDDYVYNIISDMVPYRVEMWKYTGSSESIIIPATVASKGVEYAVTKINDGVFYRRNNIKSVIIGDSVKQIGGSAFRECNSLTSVTIPEGVTIIGQEAFRECRELSSITIPNSVTSIGDLTFGYCSGLISVTLPNSITTISPYLFEGCGSLTEIVIPNSVTSIGDHAFFRCNDLTSITIPENVTSVGSEAFNECDNLKYNEYDNGLYLGNDGNSYLVLCMAKQKTITECVINNNCKIICHYAFNDCYELSTITIPESVTCIGGHAFAGSGLKSVTIPEGVTIIDGYTFSGCDNLTSVIIPNSVTNIENSAFANDYRMRSLISYAIVPPAMHKNAFWGECNPTIYVRPNSVDAYKAAGYWNQKEILPFGIVSARSNNEALGIVQGDSLLLGVSPLTITAEPNDGYHFAGWSDGNKVNPRIFTEAKDTAVTALFEAHTAVVDSAVAATCSDIGLTEGSHCSVCNAVLVAQTEIPMVEHTIVTDAAVAATATETGLTEGSHCSVCGAVIVAQEVIPALGEQGGENTNPGTAVAESAADNLQVYAHHNTIIVENATEEIRVYNAMGRLIVETPHCDVSTEIRVNTTGVYIVKVGNVAKRVMVN